MIITADTTLPGTASNTLELPLTGTDVTVDWGDGNVINYPTGGLQSHTYGVGGVKTVEITSPTGSFQGLKYSFFDDDSNDRKKITDVTQWGSTNWPDMRNAFRSCFNLTTISAADAPDLSSVTDMTRAFMFCIGLTSFPTHWDLSGVEIFDRTWEGTLAMLTGFDSYDLTSATTLKRAWYQYSNLAGLQSWGCTTSTALTSIRETWYKCDLSDCLSDTELRQPTLYKWNLSAAGTNEYYITTLADGDPGLAGDIRAIDENGTAMVLGSTESLAPGEYGVNIHGASDPDGLGFNTLYARLTDNTDPDSKPVGYLTMTEGGVFPYFEMSNVVDAAAPWVITGVRQFEPGLSFASAEDIEGILFGCGFIGLEGEILPSDWVFPKVTNALAAFQSAANINWSVAPLMPALTNGTDAWQGAGAMTSEQYEEFLINSRDVNPNNSVVLHAGTSKRTADAQDAYIDLLFRFWVITDGGMLDDYILDENGYVVRDENGDPLIAP
jgi:hypothetical protein